MNPTMVFFFIVLALMALLTFLSVQVVRILCAQAWKKRASKIVLALNFLSIAGIAGSKSIFIGMPFAGELLQTMVIWFMFQLILISLFAVCRGILFVWHKMKPSSCSYDQSKRHFLQQAVCLPAAAGALSLYGGLVESRAIENTNFDIRLKNLPENFKGFSIAQLSDVHLGYFFSLDRLDEVLGQIVAKKPDVLLITGDLFDDREHNEQAADLVNSYVKGFPQGIYFCWGNHEYMAGKEKIAASLARTKIKVLAGSAVRLLDGERPLYLLGVDYPIDRLRDQAVQCEETMHSAMKDVPEAAVKVLMAHHSIFIDYAFANGVDLTMTGHTHGGQIGLFGIPLFPLFKYTRGMYQQEAFYGYVNSGAGSWCPFRLGCPPEISYFRLS